MAFFSPMAFFPYKCAQGRVSPPKNVHMSHIEMMKHTDILFGILSPFCHKETYETREMKERKEDMNKGKK